MKKGRRKIKDGAFEKVRRSKCFNGSLKAVTSQVVWEGRWRLTLLPIPIEKSIRQIVKLRGDKFVICIK